MKTTHLIPLALLALAAAVHAQQDPADHAAHHPPGVQATTQPLSEGEVREVDIAQGQVTLRHGPLANLDMPAMTMVFAATDKKMLQGLKQGDKVRFAADKKDGGFVVTTLEVVR